MTVCSFWCVTIPNPVLKYIYFSALEKIVTVNSVIIWRGHHCIEQIALPGCKGDRGRSKPHIHKEMSPKCYHVLELPKRSKEIGRHIESIHTEIWAKICKFTGTFPKVKKMCFFLFFTALCVQIYVH